MKRSPLIPLSLTVFIDMFGFSIILPILPYYAEAYGASATAVGLLFAAYSIMQFFFAPVWGRVSDRMGRKPVLIIGLIGAAVGLFLFGIAGSLLMLFASRILAGAMTATVPVAQAYVSDVTTPEDRAKGMGMLGALMGLGFILGPAVGGVLSRYGNGAPALFASGLAVINVLMTLFMLPESLHPDIRKERWMPMGALKTSVRMPAVLLTFGVFFLSLFAFAAMEATFGLIVEDHFLVGESAAQLARQVGYLFGYSGLIMVIIQGGLLGRLVKRFGEPPLIAFALLCLTIGLAFMPLGKSIGWLLWTLGLLSVGSALMRPTVAAVLSRLVPDTVQGGVLAMSQSLSSASRAAGPAWGGWMYHAFGFETPFLAGSVITAVAFLGSLPLIRLIARQTKKA